MVDATGAGLTLIVVIAILATLGARVGAQFGIATSGGIVGATFGLPLAFAAVYNRYNNL